MILRRIPSRFDSAARTAKIALITALVAVGLVACKKTIPDSQLVAKIDGEGITKVEFDAMVDRAMKRYSSRGQKLPAGIQERIKQSVFRKAIEQKIIEMKAKSLGIAVPQAEIDAKYADHRKRFKTDQAFQDYLKRSDNTEAQLKDEFKRQMTRDRVIEKLSGDISVTDAEVEKYYEENKRRYAEKAQVEVARIMHRLPRDADDAAVKAAEKKAQESFKKASAAGADFGALAKELSEGPHAARGGRIGWMTRGRMPPEFDAVAFSLEPGKISDPIKTKSGFEIIKVLESKPERTRTLEEVAATIKESLMGKKRTIKRREVMQGLKKDVKIEQLIKFETPKAPAQAMGEQMKQKPPMGKTPPEFTKRPLPPHIRSRMLGGAKPKPVDGQTPAPGAPGQTGMPQQSPQPKPAPNNQDM